MKPLSNTSLAVLAVACAFLFCQGSSLSASAATNYVAYGGPSVAYYNFRPSSLTIHVGDTVIWTNAGGPHTVTGLSPGEPLCGGNEVNACTNVFTFPGTFLYQCNNHVSLGMTGVVNVVGAPLSPGILTNGYWTNGDFAFKVLSAANQTNIVQAATNLAGSANWVSLDTNVPAGNTFTFTDTNATQFRHRFYRVVAP